MQKNDGRVDQGPEKPSRNGLLVKISKNKRKSRKNELKRWHRKK
jgi:hypothetical protein